MPNLVPALQTTEPDEALLERLDWIERLVLSAVILLAGLNLVGWLVVFAGSNSPIATHLMKANSLLVALLCAFSLRLTGRAGSGDAQRHGRPHMGVERLGRLLAALAAVAAAVVLYESIFHATSGVDTTAGRLAFSQLLTGISVPTASGFALLGMVLLASPARRQPAMAIADVLTFCLVLLVLVLVSGHVIAALRMFGTANDASTSGMSMLALLLLTTVAFLRQAEQGVYSILLARGIGSRIARALSPVILVIPYLREAARAHFIGTSRMPAQYTTALLASLAVMLSFALLLFLAWRINAMEAEIHDLSLRDALTDLYNVRGFNLLAEQALRMARRSNLPFSVLYIDLDDLKQTNDSLGHQAGSELLMETGRILKHSFRETDVLARIGGDEFVIAGQFSLSGISLAAQRVEEAVVRRNAVNSGKPALSLSQGYFTSENPQLESLDVIIARADRAMYEAKRSKKSAVR